MKVYITKYALTRGIYAVEDASLVTINCDGTTVSVRRNHPGAAAEHFHKPDWHTDCEDAILRAREMRAKKSISLNKQLNKLWGLDLEAIRSK